MYASAQSLDFLARTKKSPLSESETSSFESGVSGWKLTKIFALLLLCLATLAGCGTGKAELKPEPESNAEEFRIAVLPVENLSGIGRAPALQLRQSLLKGLDEAGFVVLEDDRLDQFMARHRIRYVGGIDEATAKAFLEETGTKAVLITSLVHSSETFPPKIAMFCRLVSTGEKPEIVWMDGVGMAGNDSPGILDLGIIGSPRVLQEKAIDYIVDSLARQLAGEPEPADAGSGRLKPYSPKELFNASFLKKGKRYSVAVIPFFNQGERAHGGEIMTLHFVRQFAAMKDFNVLEPGVVRSSLLRMRIIIEQGVSRNDLYVISNTIGTDLLLTGKAIKYDDPTAGTPKADFSILLMDGASKKTIWASRSYNRGDDAVYFYDVGRIGTAFNLTSRMVQSLMTQLDQRSEAPVKAAPAGTDFFRSFWER